MNDIRGVVSRLLSNAASMSDTVEGKLRIGRYGDLRVAPTLHGVTGSGDEGSYWTAANPTIGTAIATAASLTAWVTTTPVFILQNNDAVGGKNVIFDYLRLLTAVIPTSATEWRWALFVDSIKRYASAGSTLTNNNANTAASASSIAQAYFGATVAAAASAQKQIAAGLVRPVIPKVWDTITVKAGSVENSSTGALRDGTAALDIGINVPPVVLGPQTSMLFYLWGAAAGATAPQYEVNAGWIER